MELTLDQALQKGVEAHKAGNAQEADRYYTAILKANPKHPDANHNMGVLAVGFGKVEEALPFFKTALEANPNMAQYWISYIDALIKLDRMVDAKAVFDQAKSNGAKGDGFDKIEKQLGLSTSSNSNVQDPPQEQLNMLKKLYSKGKLSQLVQEAQKLTKEYSNTFELWNLLGAAAAQTGRLDQAIIAFEKALLIKSDNTDVLYNMGSVYKEQGKLDNALKVIKKVISIRPDYAEAYKVSGDILYNQNNLKDATLAYENAISIKPDFVEAHQNLGQNLRDLGKFDEAVEAYKKALQFKPNDLTLQYSVSATYYKLGNMANVIENLQNLNSNTSEQNPDHSIYRLPLKIINKLLNTEPEGKDLSAEGGVTKHNGKFPLMIERPVENELVQCLYEMNSQSLNSTKDARYGEGKCSTDFRLFQTGKPIIKKVASDLFQSIESALGVEILHHESFFNILGAGGGTTPHDHLAEQDKYFDLHQFKYSLVYYLSVGDQNCQEPGIFKIYEPNVDILPDKGMGIIIPAIRQHSAIYGGKEDRIMIGCNFYAV